jgi:hypothetical protein
MCCGGRIAVRDEIRDDPYPFTQDKDESHVHSYPLEPFGSLRPPPKERVAALGGDTDPVAVPMPVLVEAGVVELEVAGLPVVVWSVDGLRSALDAPQITEGRTIGATGAFDPVLDGRRLSFTRSDDGRFTDAETGSTWNVLGRALDGPLAGAQLKPVEHLDTFWFALAAFHPGTRIVGDP